METVLVLYFGFAVAAFVRVSYITYIFIKSFDYIALESGYTPVLSPMQARHKVYLSCAMHALLWPILLVKMPRMLLLYGRRRIFSVAGAVVCEMYEQDASSVEVAGSPERSESERAPG